MSALGQKQTCAAQKVMSALPPKADMCGAIRDVPFVPIANSCTAANRICYSIISSTPIRGSLTTEASVVAVVAPSSRRTLAGHVQRKPSYTIMRGARSETYFTRLASLFNVAAGLKWSRGTVPHNEAFWSSFWVVWAEGAPSNSRLQRLARG